MDQQQMNQQENYQQESYQTEQNVQIPPIQGTAKETDGSCPEGANNILQKIIDLSTEAYDFQLGQLNKFVQAILFTQSHLEANQNWLNTDWDSIIPKGDKLPFDDYMADVPEAAVDHILENNSKAEALQNEIQNFYLRLRLLELGLDSVRNGMETMDQEHNVSVGEDYQNVKKDFFELQKRTIVSLMDVIQENPDDLGVDVTGFSVDFNEHHDHNVAVLTWITTREYLKLAKYIRKATEALVQRCEN